MAKRNDPEINLTPAARENVKSNFAYFIPIPRKKILTASKFNSFDKRFKVKDKDTGSVWHCVKRKFPPKNLIAILMVESQ